MENESKIKIEGRSQSTLWDIIQYLLNTPLCERK